MKHNTVRISSGVWEELNPNFEERMDIFWNYTKKIWSNLNFEVLGSRLL